MLTILASLQWYYILLIVIGAILGFCLLVYLFLLVFHLAYKKNKKQQLIYKIDEDGKEIK